MQKFSSQSSVSVVSWQAGFTLIEIVTVVSLFALLSFGFIAFTSNVIVGGSKQSELSATADEARKVSTKFRNELREATASNTGSYALALANDQEIIFYSNIDGGTDVERVRYYISNGKLYKGIIKPTGSPLAYTAAEISSVVQTNLANGANPLFYYYDGTYNGVNGSPLAQPVNITAVRLVKLELRVTNKGGKTNTNTNYFTVNAMSTIRNLKSNLDD